MRVVMSWLEELVDVSGVSVSELADRWTLAGLEVSSIERIGDWWDRERLVVGNVVRVEPHPNADRLVLALVDYGGSEPHKVVTGAPNLLPMREQGDLDGPMRVVFALEGVELFDGYKDGWVKMRLKGRKVRGIMSDAMVCSAKEIGLYDDHTGILVLDDAAPVGAPLVDVLGDSVVDIEITPNFARAMNMVGIARETAAILARPFEAPEPQVPTVEGDAAEWVEIEIADPDLCPRYMARVIRDVTVQPSPFRVALRLRLAGMRPINSIVDATNYAMLEWGEPLHAFDYDRLVERAGGGKPRIIVRRAEQGERMTTLDDVERELDSDMLLICDTAGPVAIAGVMGGADSEVSDETRNVLLEAAAFDFINVARTSRKLRLPSESAARFGRGVHPALAEAGSASGAKYLAELSDGEVLEGVADDYPRPPQPVTVELPSGEVERVLGVPIETETAVEILRRLEFDVDLAKDGTVRATVPPHRLDVSLPADLLEEIARVYGYDRLPSTLLADELPPQRDNPRLTVEETVRDSLVRAGLQEVISYRLVDPDREAMLQPAAPDEAAQSDVEAEVPSAASTISSDYVALANPISKERSVLRRSILTGLLEAAAANLRFRDRVAIFELGPVFAPRAEGLPDEHAQLGLLLLGPVRRRGWREGAPRPMDFFDAKGAVETLLEYLKLQGEWSRGRHPSMHPGRTAVVIVDEQVVGHVGELHPIVRAAWELGDDPVAVADLDLDVLIELAAGTSASFRPYSPYPPVHQDLAVVVADNVTAADVAAVMRRVAGPLLVDVALFDVFRGGPVREGFKSLAWSLTFQAPDKTLRSKHVEKMRQRIVKALGKELGAELR